MVGFSTAVFMEEVSAVFMDVQTELVFFGLAIATHLLFCKGLKLGASKTKVMDPMSPKKQQKGASNADLASFKAALRAGDIKSAMARFEVLRALWQQHDSPSSAPYMLLEQLVKLAAQKEALPQLLELLNKLDLLAKAIDLVLTECANQGDAVVMKQAEQLARATGVKFSAATYHALIKGASVSGSPDEAQQILVEAEKAGLADVAIYNTYIKGVLKGNIQEVRKVMDTMRTSGLRPNTVTFNGLLGAIVSLNADAAWTIVDEMKAVNIKPDNVTCSILLKSITPKSKTWVLEMVYEIMDGLDGEVDEVLISSVVEASVRVGRADLLVPFLTRQRAAKRLALKGAHTYASIIRAYGYVQDIKGAWDTWNEMRRQHITPISVTLGCMVEALVTNGDIEPGYELIHEMLADEKTAPLVNAVMYGSIVKGFSHKKCFDRVWQVYEEMREKKLQFSMVTYNTLIDACARSGELSRIPSLLKDIKAQGLQMGVVTYSAILKGYCQTNRLDEAFELLADMTRTTSLEPDEIMYNTLLDGCARQGLYDRGMALFEKMNKSAVRPSNFTLSVLVKLANRGKKLERAFEICEEETAKHGFRLNVHVYNNLVQACINHRDLQRAISVFERMLQERVRPDVRTYSLLLRGCLDERETTEAAGILRAATGLRDVHPRLVGYGVHAMQPQGGLPSDLVSEIVAGIMDTSKDKCLTTSLFSDLSRVSGIRLDSRLKLKFAARMA